MLPPIDRMPVVPGVPAIGMIGAGLKAGKALGGGAGGGGGYTFSPEELEEVLQQWEDLRDDLTRDLGDAEIVANVQGPGFEFASGDFEKAARPSGRALEEQTKRMIQHCDNYINALQNAKQGTQTQDENATEDAKKAAGGMTA